MRNTKGQPDRRVVVEREGEKAVVACSDADNIQVRRLGRGLGLGRATRQRARWPKSLGVCGLLRLESGLDLGAIAGSLIWGEGTGSR